MAAMIFALKIWRHYGKTYEIYTDHKNLKYIFYQQDLKLWQKRWMKLLKDYDYTILYHHVKENIVADALSWKSMGSLGHLSVHKNPLVRELHELGRLGVRFEFTSSGAYLVHIQVRSSLVEKVEVAKCLDLTLSKLI